MKTHARNWWPIPAMLGSVIAVQALWSDGRNHATGHAAGHLGNASVVFAIAFVVAVIIWAVPSEVRHRAEAWLLAAAILTAATYVTIGNLRVVDAIGADDWSDAQAGRLGPLRPGFASGHDLADRSAWLVIVAALLLIVWLWRRHAISRRVAIAAGIASVLFPYWIFPGAGLVLLAVALVIARAQRLQRAAGSYEGSGTSSEDVPKVAGR